MPRQLGGEVAIVANAREVLRRWARVPRPEGPGWAEPGSTGKAGTKTEMLRGLLADSRILQLATGDPAPWPVGNKHLTPQEQDQLRDVATRMIAFVERFMELIGNAGELADRLCDNPLADRQEARNWSRSAGRGRRQPFSRDALIALLDVDPPDGWVAFWDDGVLPIEAFEEANRIGIEETARAYACMLNYLSVVASAADEEFERILADLDAIRPSRWAATPQQLRAATLAELGILGPIQMWPEDLWAFIREVARILRDPDDIDPDVRELYGLWVTHGYSWVSQSKLRTEVDNARRAALIDETHGHVTEKVSRHLHRIRLGVQGRDAQFFQRWARKVAGTTATDIFNQYYERVRDHLGNEVVDEEGRPNYRPKSVLFWVSFGFGSDQDAIASDEQLLEPEEGSDQSGDPVGDLVDRFATAVSVMTAVLPGMVGPEVEEWVRSMRVRSVGELRRNHADDPPQSLAEFLLYLTDEGIGVRGQSVRYLDSPDLLVRDMSRACHRYLKARGVEHVSPGRIERVFVGAWTRVSGTDPGTL
jgi:hypothetical protein